MRILEEMSDKANPGFSLDQFSEAETDEEFGLPEFKEHFADSLTPAVLRDWTAKDFASIYVRFRPHLERHAKRFLVNPSQVEEVVQDAFLYLMTTLPELDSELGVLKFLKWKVRLLAIDVIRANSRASIAPLEELAELESGVPETTQGLERAEDAAIVSLALAKISPRHREALIATLYEEKSNSVVADQMGLSENALRQLLFRARASFRKALVGEAETAGLTISEILSLAARKARQGGYKATLGFAMVLVLSAVVPISDFLSPANNDSGSLIALRDDVPAKAIDGWVYSGNPSSAAESAAGIETLDVAEPPLSPIRQSTPASKEPLSAVGMSESEEKDGSEIANQESHEEQIAALFLREQANSIRLASESSIEQLNGSLGSQISGQGLSLRLPINESVEMSLVINFSETGPQVSYMWLVIQSGESTLNAAPKVISQKTSVAGDASLLELAATDLVVGDLSGDFDYSTTTDTKIFKSGIRMSLRFEGEEFVNLSDFQVIDREPAA